MKKYIFWFIRVIGNPFDRIRFFALSICLLLATLDGFAQTPDTWTQKADFGETERYGAVGFSIGTKGYLGTGFRGGYDPPVSEFKDFWEYDPNTDVWAQKADFGGTARLAAVGFSIGSKGYIGTGGTTFGNIYKDFWEYDPTANTWTQKTDFGGLARYAAIGFSIGTKGYIGTGYNGSYFADFWEYDPITDIWTQKTSFPGGARSYAASFVIGSKGYLGTGYRQNGGPSKDFYEYNPSTNTWTQKADFGGTARFVSTGFSIGSKGYIGTGHDVGHGKDF